MKGIDMMNSDFQTTLSVGNVASLAAAQPFNCAAEDRFVPQSNANERSNSGAAQRAQSGFLAQSVDEIARLYVESPFSW